MSKKILMCLGILLLLSSLVYSQVRTGNIYGIVTDNEGTALPGVAVKLTGSRISLMTAITTTAGNFRFLSLAPGNDYKLVFELAGFKTFIRDNLEVGVGVNVDLKIAMELGQLEQEVVVTAHTPVVDPKKTTVQTNVSRETMQTLPSARDPWVILEMAPGVMVDRENVGGNESGQQSNFLGRGDSGDNAQWNIDGVNISDPAAVGASPMYFDFDMFEEMNVQTAANDVTAVTGGININFVTPRGGNKFVGGARFYWTDKSLQSDNRTTAMKSLLLAGNKVKNILDYGFNVGGPIFKDKLWFWGSYGVQNIKQLKITGDPDNTDLTTMNLKLNAQLGAQRLEGYFVYSNKIKDGRTRTGGYLDTADATYKQNGPSYVYKLQDEITFSQNFFLSVKASYVPMMFELSPKGGTDKIIYQDYILNKRWNTGDYFKTNRPIMYGDITGNYFMEDFLGANHEWKFGVEYKNAMVDSLSSYSGGIARLADGVPYQYRFYNNQPENFYANRISAYFQDSLDFGKLTLNLGLRYDRQWGGIRESTAEATSFALMNDVGGVNYNWPAVTQAAGDFPFTWNMFSPRVSLIYDLFGNSKTLLKASFSIYGSQFDATAAYVMFFNYAYHRFDWIDTSGDKLVQTNELTFNRTVDLTEMSPLTKELIGDYFDKNVSPEKTMEILVGVEHELTADLGVGANVQYRKMYDFNWNKFLVYDYLNGSAIRQAQHSDWAIAGTIGGQTYWDLSSDVGYTFTNFMTKRPDYYQTYLGLELSFKKRLTNKWMMDVSFTYQDHKVNFPSVNSYQDPTDHLPVDKLSGQPQAYQASGSGSSNVFMNSRWIFKVGGLYQLPYGFSLSGTFSAREGFISPAYYEDTGYSNYNGDSAAPWAETFGKTRDPNMYLLNLRLERKFALGSFGNIYIGLDGFNIFNSNVRLARQRNMSASNYNDLMAIMSPRIFRLGVRFEF